MNHNLQQGKLKRWDDDKGFGFIGSENGRTDIFVHISAFKRMGLRPIVGDVIIYQIQMENDGKKVAINAKIEDATEVKLSPRRKKIIKQKNNNLISNILSVVLVVAIGSIAYKEFTDNEEPHEERKSPISSYAVEEENVKNYGCEGKVYCSEMTSCDEAIFYQRNCPGTKMDGDRDGIPCERQWCSW